MRLSLSCLLMLLAFGAAPSEAALRKYSLHRTGINEQDGTSATDLSPRCFAGAINPAEKCKGHVLINVFGPIPILRDFEFVVDTTVTIPIPSITTSIFLSLRSSEGPTGTATGSGGTASGNSLRWGSVTGWTITGSRWCQVRPAIICTLAGAMDKETTDPPPPSSFYDLGTWTFHGTGFTSVPFVSVNYTTSFGNLSLAYRGALLSDATIPALPALGVIALAALLAGGAASALRRSVRIEP